jgi:DNA repair exonuclease SbcCD ATPase subunit
MKQQIKLVSLSLKNFKGVTMFTLDASGENVKVLGDNATGKTTLFDSFVWLLFDKDSQNKKDFAIKTLTLNGEEHHGLNHAVEGTFLLNGIHLTLKKVYSEKWTKKRGSAQQEFSGHTTDYFIDGVPVKLKEYKEKVDSIVQEDIFKLLTSPAYFNEQLKWQDRRKTLLEICGDLSDEEVIASNHLLTNVPTILQGRTIENHRKVIAARRSEINKELDKIPVRIDEIKRNLPDLSQLNKAVIDAEIGRINTSIDENMTLINTIKNGSAVTEKQKKIKEIEMDLLQIKRDHESDSKDKVYQLKAKIQEEQSNVSILNSKLENVKNQKRFNDQNLQTIDTQLSQLRQDWFEVDARQFTHTDACECPTCGQSLPQEQVEDAKSKALSQFNVDKAKQLEEINAKGKQGNESKEQYLKNNEALAKENEKLNGQISEKNESLKKLSTQLTQLEATVVDVLENPTYVSNLQEKKAIESEIATLRQMSEQSIQDVQLIILELRTKRDQLQNQLGYFAQHEQSKTRIDELMQQERNLAAEFEKLEQELYLTEEFTRSKVALLEEKINSRFKYARFKLFKQNINGGLEETCETLFNGVPYSSGLNNAARINVGLDIINTLSEHYGFAAPIFVDNSEAVTRLIDTNSQVISLVVSEADKQLRVEHLKRLDDLLTVDCEVLA